MNSEPDPPSRPSSKVSTYFIWQMHSTECMINQDYLPLLCQFSMTLDKPHLAGQSDPILLLIFPAMREIKSKMHF